jgi:hypothetical protein
MKKTTILTMIAFVAIILSSCGGGSKEFTVKNNSVDFAGDLQGYLEVVDGNYTVSKPGSELILTIKLKAIKQLESTKEFDEIRLELTDESGMPISGMSTFTISKSGWCTTESENTKVDNALKSGSGDFAVQFVYDTYSTGGGSLSRSDALKIASKKAKGFSITNSKFKEEAVSSSESSSSSYSSTSDDEDDEEVVAKKSGSENWDKILVDYEAYTDKYIKLLKKANAGDMSVMTEYMEMLEKAQEFQESLENADDDLSPAQMQKFTKIQMKLMNAATSI